jgi:DNA-binding transcriptional regulator PaaX
MRKYKNTTHHIVAALVPYTQANIQLAFKPTQFFYELNKTDGIKESTARGAYYRSIHQGLVIVDENQRVHLTDRGKKALRPYSSKDLLGAHIMVVFDIPEGDRWKRSKLRALLRELKFKQVQKSVWITKMDCQAYLQEEIESVDLNKEVLVYECRPLTKFTKL